MRRNFHHVIERNGGYRPVLLLLLTVMVGALTGCASPILMKNPANGEIAQCYSPGNIFRRYHERDKCVEQYQKEGWVATETP